MLLHRCWSLIKNIIFSNVWVRPYRRKNWWNAHYYGGCVNLIMTLLPCRPSCACMGILMYQTIYTTYLYACGLYIGTSPYNTWYSEVLIIMHSMYIYGMYIEEEKHYTLHTYRHQTQCYVPMHVHTHEHKLTHTCTQALYMCNISDRSCAVYIHNSQQKL